MTPEQEAAITAALDDEQATALTMVAEAAGDNAEGASSVEERLAVGTVIRNRVQASGRRWAKTFRGVCLARSQFSCWNPGTDPNHVRLMALAGRLVAGLASDDPIYAETVYLARGIIGGVILDRTGGATHYYAPAAMNPAGSKPFWVYLNGKNGPEHRPTAVIGSQVFYRNV